MFTSNWRQVVVASIDVVGYSFNVTRNLQVRIWKLSWHLGNVWARFSALFVVIWAAPETIAVFEQGQFLRGVRRPQISRVVFNGWVVVLWQARSNLETEMVDLAENMKGQHPASFLFPFTVLQHAACLSMHIVLKRSGKCFPPDFEERQRPLRGIDLVCGSWHWGVTCIIYV